MPSEAIDVKRETGSLPKNYPLSRTARTELNRSQPPSKTTYNDKYIQPFISEVHKCLIDTISMKLEMAAQKYSVGDISQEEYEKGRDDIYQSLIGGDWINGITDAFNEYSLSTDAYSLLVHSAFQTPETTVTISNIYEHVSAENEALSSGQPPTYISLTESFDEHFASLKSRLGDSIGKEEKEAILKTKQIIFVATYPERPLPFSLENVENETSRDDEIEVGGGKINLTCPISREIFVKPYRNIECNHCYDLDALKIFLRTSKECPECGVPVSISSIEPDLIMQARIDCYKRDQKLNSLIKERLRDDNEKL